MIYVALGELVVVLVLVAVVAYERKRVDDILLEQQRVAHAERRELLTRIQRPDLVPIARTPAPPQRERKQDEIGAVGTFTPPQGAPVNRG